MCSDCLAHVRWGLKRPNCRCVHLPPRALFPRFLRGLADLGLFLAGADGVDKADGWGRMGQMRWMGWRLIRENQRRDPRPEVPDH
eukprot:8256500-Alexandrium_andersonii.AAC.1